MTMNNITPLRNKSFSFGKQPVREQRFGREDKQNNPVLSISRLGAAHDELTNQLSRLHLQTDTLSALNADLPCVHFQRG